MKTPLVLGSVALVILLTGSIYLLVAAPHGGPQVVTSRPTESDLTPRATTPPTIGTPSTSPTFITANTPTIVTVTVSITPAPILNSVNLLRLGATGTQPTILGVMQNAGNGIYTLQVPFNESTGGEIQLQVSAAFQGSLRRVFSNLVDLDVWGDILVTSTPVSFAFNIPPQWTAVQQPTVINILRPNTSLDPTQEYAGDFVIFVDANPSNLPPGSYYNGTFGEDLYSDSTTTTSFMVSGHTALDFSDTTGIDAIDTVIITVPNYFLRIEDRGDPTTFNELVQTLHLK